ncbi:MAG: hypothetical protein ABJO36_02265 [Litorimonas sp.]
MNFAVIIFGQEIELLKPLVSAVFSAAGILFVFFVRSVLDWRVAPWLVWLFSKIPTAGFELNKHSKLKGSWNHVYLSHDGAGSNPKWTSHDKKVHQFSSYLYSVFHTDGVKYYILGKIVDGYVTGEWRAHKQEINSYAGAFQFKIVDENTLKGTWIGFSKSEGIIRHGSWDWEKVA